MILLVLLGGASLRVLDTAKSPGSGHYTQEPTFAHKTAMNTNYKYIII
jgi:hypothetical protein